MEQSIACYLVASLNETDRCLALGRTVSGYATGFGCVALLLGWSCPFYQGGGIAQPATAGQICPVIAERVGRLCVQVCFGKKCTSQLTQPKPCIKVFTCASSRGSEQSTSASLQVLDWQSWQ